VLAEEEEMVNLTIDPLTPKDQETNKKH